MILTQCAVCATELGLSLGKKCGRCSTRYCGPECQKQHWEGGGHDKLCKPIKRAGGAEQYNANTKYAEAVGAAAEACAEDTKGQTCYICTQALHWKTKEGLVRMCSCRGTAGFAHVSCLAEEAKILVAEALERNLGNKALERNFCRWYKCSLCEQKYHGDVKCALGWACWKTYVGRLESDRLLSSAMRLLGNGLFAAEHYEDAAFVQETDFSIARRLGAPERDVLAMQSNLASTYQRLGRLEDVLRMRRDVYSGWLKLNGKGSVDTLREACNYAFSLTDLKRFEEAKALMRKTMPVARRVLGDSHETTLRMRASYAQSLYMNDRAPLDDLREAVTTFEETERIARRVLGGARPLTLAIEANAREARDRLVAREGGRDVSSVCDAVAATTPGDA